MLLAAATAGEGSTIAGPDALLTAVPRSFLAERLAGYWVTSYQFTHRGKPHFHADIAHVTAGSDRRPAYARALSL